MNSFTPGFYKHFKGKFYLAYGIGAYGQVNESAGDVLFAQGMYHEHRKGDEVQIYRKRTGDFVIQGEQNQGVLVVIYQELYGTGSFCVREVDLFCGEKELADGSKVRRFVFLGEEMPDELKGT